MRNYFCFFAFTHNICIIICVFYLDFVVLIYLFHSTSLYCLLLFTMNRNYNNLFQQFYKNKQKNIMQGNKNKQYMYFSSFVEQKNPQSSQNQSLIKQMTKSSYINPSSSTKSNINSSIIINLPHTINYLPNQAQSDNELRKLLDLLTQFNCSLIPETMDYASTLKNNKICSKLAAQLTKIDNQHRSYNKIESLVNVVHILVSLQDIKYLNTTQYNAKLAQLHRLMFEQQRICQQINRPQYFAKMYLLDILLLHNDGKYQRQNDAENKIKIKKKYRKFASLQFSDSMIYYNHNFWEEYRILQILVYQFILVLQKLAQFNEEKTTFLYKRGQNIANKLLGKNHRFTLMMGRIIVLRKNTKKLLFAGNQMLKGRNTKINQQAQESSKRITSKSIQSKLNYHNKKKQIINSQIYKQQIRSLTKKKHEYRQKSIDKTNKKLKSRTCVSEPNVNKNQISIKSTSKSKKNCNQKQDKQPEPQKCLKSLEIIQITNKIPNQIPLTIPAVQIPKQQSKIQQNPQKVINQGQQNEGKEFSCKII